MMINPDLVSPCGLYCGVCAIYIAHRDNNVKLKEGLVRLYKGGTPGKGTLPNSESLSVEDIRCRGCLSDERFMHCQQCEDQGLHNNGKATPDVINAMSFLASISIIFPWLSAKRLFCGPFRTGERLALKNGFKMKKPAIFALNAAIRSSGALQNVISVKRSWIIFQFGIYI